MKTKLFLALCLVMIIVSACSNNNDEPANRVDPKDVKAKSASFPASAYDSWVFVNLENGDTAIRKDVNEWEYHQLIVENGKYKRNADGSLAYEVTKTVKAGTPNEPKTWHLAFHVYDVRTNGGEAMITKETMLDKVKLTDLTSGTYEADKDIFIVVDMAGMQKNLMGYSKGQANLVLGKWLTSVGMPPKRTLSDKVFVVKFKDGSYALLKFNDYFDDTGKQKMIKFDYKLIKKNA